MLFPVFQWRDQCQCHQQNLQVFTISEQLSILWLLPQYIFPCPISKTGIITSASTHQLTNAPLSIGSWLGNSTRYTDRLTPGKTYTHLSHLSVFPSYEGKNIQSLLLIEKKPPTLSEAVTVVGTLCSNYLKAYQQILSRSFTWPIKLLAELLFLEVKRFTEKMKNTPFQKPSRTLERYFGSWQSIYLPSYCMLSKVTKRKIRSIANINAIKFII